MFFRYPGFDFAALHCSPSVAESTASLDIGLQEKDARITVLEAQVAECKPSSQPCGAATATTPISRPRPITPTASPDLRQSWASSAGARGVPLCCCQYYFGAWRAIKCPVTQHGEQHVAAAAR
jgi:hypothetical protein